MTLHAFLQICAGIWRTFCKVTHSSPRLDTKVIILICVAVLLPCCRLFPSISRLWQYCSRMLRRFEPVPKRSTTQCTGQLGRRFASNVDSTLAHALDNFVSERIHTDMHAHSDSAKNNAICSVRSALVQEGRDIVEGVQEAVLPYLQVSDTPRLRT